MNEIKKTYYEKEKKDKKVLKIFAITILSIFVFGAILICFFREYFYNNCCKDLMNNNQIEKNNIVQENQNEPKNQEQIIFDQQKNYEENKDESVKNLFKMQINYLLEQEFPVQKSQHKLLLLKLNFLNIYCKAFNSNTQTHTENKNEFLKFTCKECNKEKIEKIGIFFFQKIDEDDDLVNNLNLNLNHDDIISDENGKSFTKEQLLYKNKYKKIHDSTEKYNEFFYQKIEEINQIENCSENHKLENKTFENCQLKCGYCIGLNIRKKIIQIKNILTQEYLKLEAIPLFVTNNNYSFDSFKQENPNINLACYIKTPSCIESLYFYIDGNERLYNRITFSQKKNIFFRCNEEKIN